MEYLQRTLISSMQGDLIYIYEYIQYLHIIIHISLSSGLLAQFVFPGSCPCTRVSVCSSFPIRCFLYGIETILDCTQTESRSWSADSVPVMLFCHVTNRTGQDNLILGKNPYFESQ